MQDALRLFWNLPEVFRKLFVDSIALKTLTGVAAAIVQYIFPESLQKFFIGAGVLILLDTLTGVWATLVTRKPISSAKFSRVLTKIFGYGSVCIVCSVVSNTIPHANGLHEPSVTVVLTFVIGTEAISILENVGRMGVKAPPSVKKYLKDKIDKS